MLTCVFFLYGQIRDACLDGYVQPVVDRVKPVVTYVQDVVDNSRKRVSLHVIVKNVVYLFAFQAVHILSESS